MSLYEQSQCLYIQDLKMVLKDCLPMTKKWLFSFIFIIDSTKVTHTGLFFLMILCEQVVLTYYYFHPIYDYLYSYALVQQYAKLVNQYVIIIVPFTNQIFSLLTLVLYPAVIGVVILINQIGFLKPLVILVQVATYFLPVLFIKIIIQMTVCFKNVYLLYCTIPLSLLSVAFAALVLLLNKRMFRIIQIPFIIAMELGANPTAIMVLLGLRLIALFYYFYPRSPFIMDYTVEVGMFFVNLNCLVFPQATLNYVSHSIIVISFSVFGMYRAYLSYEDSLDIYDKVQNLDEEEDCTYHELITDIQKHNIQCVFPDCKCRNYLNIENSELKDFVYEIQQKILNKKNGFEDRLNYAQKCAQKYEFKLSGLINLYQHHPTSIYEEYQIMRVCSLFENNMRKQDKNYKYGQQYFNVNEEEHAMTQDMLTILHMIKQFWQIITYFDGSTKFLTLILKISQAITKLDENVNRYSQKYDEEFSKFKYLIDLFRTLILNEKISEEDQVAVPDSVTYAITCQGKIIGANNNFSILVNRSLENILGTSYYSFIPEIYQEPHKQWVENYIEKNQQYEDKKLSKTFALDKLQIKLVQMTHKILPRFMKGLQILTLIEYPVQQKKVNPDSFMFIVEKENLFIKNVEGSFYEFTKFKASPRNIKMLQQMSLNSVFGNIVTTMGSKNTYETMLLPQFIEEFTTLKRKKNTRRTNRSNQQSSSRIQDHKQTTKTKHSDFIQVLFEYELVPNVRADDPYLKIMFKSRSLNSNLREASEDSSKNNSKELLSQDIGRNKSKQAKSINFHLPFYIVLYFIVMHVLFLFSSMQMQEAFVQIKKRSDFLVAYDYTILYGLGVYIGKDQSQILQDLWIKGYGNYSQSLNALNHVYEPDFSTYFYTQIVINFHTKLHDHIQQVKNEKFQIIDICSTILLALFGAGMLFYVIDFVCSVVYIFRVQNKVGKLLLQFVVVNEDDIGQLCANIDSFIANVLHHQNYQPIVAETEKVHVQTVEDSGFQLMKGSPNNSGIQDMQAADYIVQTKTSKRRGSSFNVVQKRLLSDIRSQFQSTVQHRGSGSLKKHKSYSSQQIQRKQENIDSFKQQYGSFYFLFKANIKLFIMLFVALAISLTMIGVFFVLIDPPISDLEHRLTVLQSLYDSKIILLKSLAGIAIAYSDMEPQKTVSQNLLQSLQLLKNLPDQYFQQFQNQYRSALTDNVCKIHNNSICASGNSTSLTNYGLNIITQRIQQYFRLKSQSDIKVNNTHNILIQYSEQLFTTLIINYLQACDDYDSHIYKVQSICVILGTITLVVGLILNYLSLKQCKNRVEDSKALLKIIPQSIKDKHNKQLQVFVSREQEISDQL